MSEEDIYKAMRPERSKISLPKAPVEDRLRQMADYFAGVRKELMVEAADKIDSLRCQAANLERQLEQGAESSTFEPEPPEPTAEQIDLDDLVLRWSGDYSVHDATEEALQTLVERIEAALGKGGEG